MTSDHIYFSRRIKKSCFVQFLVLNLPDFGDVMVKKRFYLENGGKK